MTFQVLAPYFPPSFSVQVFALVSATAPFFFSPSLSLPVSPSRGEHTCLPSLARGCEFRGPASVLSGLGDRVLVRANDSLGIVERVLLVGGREASELLDGSLLVDEVVWDDNGIE